MHIVILNWYLKIKVALLINKILQVRNVLTNMLYNTVKSCSASQSLQFQFRLMGF